MTRKEAKKWAELFTAYAEGKQLQYQLNKEWIDAKGELNERHIMYMTAGSLRIKPEPKTRRMTNQELSDWLRDESQEHREIKKRGFGNVYPQLAYMEIEADKECGDVLIRRNHGEWEEPIIKMEE